MMLQSIDKKRSIFFYILILFFLSTISNISLNHRASSLLQVNKIEVSGLDNDLNTIIEKKLEYIIGKNIFLLNNRDIENKLNNIDYIHNYTVSRSFPSEVNVKLKKTKLLAVTYRDNKLLYVGSNKKIIFFPKKIQDDSLPIIFGNFSNKEFFDLRHIINDSKFDIKKITEYYYFPSKRWDIKLNNEILVKLPIENINDSINILNEVLKENVRKQNKVVDLRVSNQIIFSNE